MGENHTAWRPNNGKREREMEKFTNSSLKVTRKSAIIGTNCMRKKNDPRARRIPGPCLYAKAGRARECQRSGNTIEDK